MVKKCDVGIGSVCGRLTVIEESERVGYVRKWLCRCSCGNEKIIAQSHLSTGHTQSCGCIYREKAAVMNVKHNLSNSPEFQTWLAMRARCNRPSHIGYSHYGGRGIKVCERWENSFEDFYSDMGQKPTLKHSIDRIDVNGNYSPDNCKWATDKEQKNNKTTSVKLTFNGETLNVVDWERRTGIGRKTIAHRIRKGWSIEDTLTVKPELEKPIEFNGVSKTVTEWAKEYGMKRNTLYARLTILGWDIGKSLSEPVQEKKK